jgi:hypothetical protein
MAARIVRNMARWLAVGLLVQMFAVAIAVAAPAWVTMSETAALVYQIDRDSLRFSGAEADRQLDVWMKTVEKEHGSYLLSHYLVREKGLTFILKEKKAFSATDEARGAYINPGGEWKATTAASPIGSIALRLFADDKNGLAPGTTPPSASPAPVPASPGPAVVTVQADPRLPAELVAKVKRVCALTSAFFEQKQGVTLSRPVDVVLLTNEADYRKALIEKLKHTPEEADRLVKHTNGVSRWHIVSWGLRKGAPDWAVYLHIGHELTHTYQAQIAGGKPPGKITWLWEGIADMIPAQLMAEDGVQTLAQSRKSWLDVVRKGAVHPELRSMQNQSQWFAAQDAYGSQNVTRLATIAADYLVEKKGYGALLNYVKLAGTMDGEAAFATAFGMTHDQFSADFQGYLKGLLGR